MAKREVSGGSEAKALSRSSRKKNGSSRKLPFGALLRGLVRLMVIVALALLGTILFFLSSLNDEGIAARAPKAGEPLNILFIGVDAGLLEGGNTMVGRSDVLLLLSLDTKAHSAMLLSIPRDTWTELPNVGEAKINAAHVFGGPEMVLSAVAELLNQPIHYFVKLNFEGFAAIVDAAGGVSIDVEKDMYYYDPYDVPALEIDLKAGLQHLNGEKALQYVRYRDATGDIGRSEQQKKLFLALLQKLSSPLNYWRLPGVSHQAQQQLSTNFKLPDILRCGWSLLTLAESPRTEVLPGEPSYDGAYWLPHYADAQALFSTPQESDAQNSWFNLDQLFHRPQKPSKAETRLIILNGNGGQGSASKAAHNLQLEEYQVVQVDDADSYDYAKSVIVYNKDAEAKARLLLGSLPGATLQEAENDNPACDLVVIIGTDYLR